MRCADPFHVVAWATDALDEVRRQAWNDARAQARTDPRRPRGPPRGDAARPAGPPRAGPVISLARCALWKNPENLTESQHDKLAWIAKPDPRLHSAYLLKEAAAS